MNVTLNNRSVALSNSLTLDVFLASQLQNDGDVGANAGTKTNTKTNANTYAVAINMQFVPKANYASTMLQDGDVIELLAPMQGG